MTSHSKTLIDNIFSNNTEEGLISGNIISTISYHFSQFLLIKNDQELNKEETAHIFKHDFSMFDKKKSESDIRNIGRHSVLDLQKENVDQSFSKFFEIFKNTLQKHAPLRKLTKKEKQLHKKTWITKGILKSVNIKNTVY